MQVYVHIIRLYLVNFDLVFKAIKNDVGSYKFKNLWHWIAVGRNMLTFNFHGTIYKVIKEINR